MLFILVVEGIGTGLILNGEVYGGSRIGIGGKSDIFRWIPPDAGAPAAALGAGRRSPPIQLPCPICSVKSESKVRTNSVQELIALAQSGNSASAAGIDCNGDLHWTGH